MKFESFRPNSTEDLDKQKNITPENILPAEKAEEPSVEKNDSASLEKIKNIYNKGRLYLLSTVVGLSMFQSDTSTTKADINRFQKEFKNITELNASKIYNDLHQILDTEYLNKLVRSDLDSMLPADLMDDAVRGQLLKLNSLYKVDFDYLYFSAFRGDTAALKDPEVWEKIKEIRNEYPSDYTPTVNSIPLEGKLDFLKDPAYLEGIKRLARIGMTDQIIYAAKDAVAQVATDDEYYDVLKKLNSMGGYFDASIVRQTSLATLKDTNHVRLSQKDIVDHKKILDQFALFPHKNQKVLKYLHGCPLNYNMLLSLSLDTEGVYLDFFENPNNQRSIEKIKSFGYEQFFLFSLCESPLRKFINEPTFIRLLGKLFKKTGSPLTTLMVCSDSYGLQTIEGIRELSHNLNKIDEIDADVALLSLSDKLNELKKQDNFQGIFKTLEQGHTLDSEEAGEKFNDFAKDPALEIVKSLGYQKNPPAYLDSLSPRLQAEWLMRTARNMLMDNIEITPEIFEQTFYETVGLRTNKELMNISLFKDRNVALFAHNEKWGDYDTAFSDLEGASKIKGIERFGKKAVIYGIENQHPKNIISFKAENSIASLENTKKQFLSYAENHSNLTIVVDAHGGPKDIYFTEGVIKNGKVTSSDESSISVSDVELANSLSKRYDKGFKDTAIIIMASCYNHNFIRNLNNDIALINQKENKNIPMPICAGESEYGQYGFSSFTSKYGDDFLELILKNKKDTKLKDVVEIEAANGSTGMESNISLFVPYAKEIKKDNNKKIKQKVFYQIAQNGGSPMEKVVALQYAEDLMNPQRDPKTISYYEYAEPQNARRLKNIIEESSAENVV